MRFLLVCFLMLPFVMLGQGGQPIHIDDTQNIEDVIKALQGPGTEITNITYSVPGQLKAMGYFEDHDDLLGLRKGLVITTESARLAVGPNNDAGSLSTQPKHEMLDADLTTITNGHFFDIAIVEFDIKTRFSNFSFNYVFGSEEYAEFVGNIFNDTFGFFISGPGINGNKNLATLANGSPISINTINQFLNSEYFILNGDGSTPDVNYYLQYDGLTKKLIATTRVIPNETYHIKIIIADVGDHNFDTGVFIEQESFVSEIPYSVKVSYEHDRFDYAIEGCNRAYLTIERDAQDAADPLELDIRFEGSADNGNDFPLIQTGPFVLAPGELTSIIEIAPFADAISEGDENLITHVSNTFTGKLITTELTISDELDYGIGESTICTATPTVINNNPEVDFNFKWEPNDGLSCLDCPSPTATLTQDTEFHVEVTHVPSGCQGTTTANVLVNNFQYSFNDELICNNTLTAINKAASNDYVYRWADNQGLTCLNCPSPGITASQDAILLVEVEEVASGCKTDSELTLNVFKFDFTFGETSVCENRPTIINRSPSPGYTFTWQPHSAFSCTNCSSPSVLLDQTITIQVKVREEVNDCEITKLVPIEVKEVEEYKVPDSFVCKGEESAINVDASDNFIYRWKANPAVSCTDCKSPKVKLDMPATFPVQIEEIKTGCKTETQALVKVNHVDYQILPVMICANEATAINKNAPEPYLFQWEPDESLSCGSCPSPFVKAATDLQLHVLVEDTRVGCHTRLTVHVQVNKVEAYFTYTITDQYSSILVDFKNQSNGANSYQWSFGDGNNSNQVETTYQYELKGESVQVQLTAINNTQGVYCDATHQTTIFIHEPVFIPNVITPNGDTYNEIFEVKGIEKGLWSLTVFNSWGNRVYYSEGYHNDWHAENISSGIYYYELRNPQDNKSFKGWVHVVM